MEAGRRKSGKKGAVGHPSGGHGFSHSRDHLQNKIENFLSACKPAASESEGLSQPVHDAMVFFVTLLISSPQDCSPDEDLFKLVEGPELLRVTTKEIIAAGQVKRLVAAYDSILLGGNTMTLQQLSRVRSHIEGARLIEAVKDQNAHHIDELLKYLSNIQRSARQKILEYCADTLKLHPPLPSISTTNSCLIDHETVWKLRELIRSHDPLSCARGQSSSRMKKPLLVEEFMDLIWRDCCALSSGSNVTIAAIQISWSMPHGVGATAQCVISLLQMSPLSAREDIGHKIARYLADKCCNLVTCCSQSHADGTDLSSMKQLKRQLQEAIEVSIDCLSAMIFAFPSIEPPQQQTTFEVSTPLQETCFEALSYICGTYCCLMEYSGSSTSPGSPSSVGKTSESSAELLSDGESAISISRLLRRYIWSRISSTETAIQFVQRSYNHITNVCRSQPQPQLQLHARAELCAASTLLIGNVPRHASQVFLPLFETVSRTGTGHDNDDSTPSPSTQRLIDTIEALRSPHICAFAICGLVHGFSVLFSSVLAPYCTTTAVYCTKGLAGSEERGGRNREKGRHISGRDGGKNNHGVDERNCETRQKATSECATRSLLLRRDVFKAIASLKPLFRSLPLVVLNVVCEAACVALYQHFADEKAGIESEDSSNSGTSHPHSTSPTPFAEFANTLIEAFLSISVDLSELLSAAVIVQSDCIGDFQLVSMLVLSCLEDPARAKKVSAWMQSIFEKRPEAVIRLCLASIDAVDRLSPSPGEQSIELAARLHAVVMQLKATTEERMRRLLSILRCLSTSILDFTKKHLGATKVNAVANSAEGIAEDNNNAVAVLGSDSDIDDVHDLLQNLLEDDDHEKLTKRLLLLLNPTSDGKGRGAFSLVAIQAVNRLACSADPSVRELALELIAKNEGNYMADIQVSNRACKPYAVSIVAGDDDNAPHAIFAPLERKLFVFLPSTVDALSRPVLLQRIEPLQLDLLLSSRRSLPGTLASKSSVYGVCCPDFMSLTFLVIHSVRSTLKIVPQSPIEPSPSICTEVVHEVDEGCLHVAAAHAGIIVLPALASTMRWHLRELLIQRSLDEAETHATYVLSCAEVAAAVLHSESLVEFVCLVFDAEMCHALQYHAHCASVSIVGDSGNIVLSATRFYTLTTLLEIFLAMVTDMEGNDNFERDKALAALLPFVSTMMMFLESHSQQNSDRAKVAELVLSTLSLRLFQLCERWAGSSFCILPGMMQCFEGEPRHLPNALSLNFAMRVALCRGNMFHTQDIRLEMDKVPSGTNRPSVSITFSVPSEEQYTLSEDARYTLQRLFPREEETDSAIALVVPTFEHIWVEKNPHSDPNPHNSSSFDRYNANVVAASDRDGGAFDNRKDLLVSPRVLDFHCNVTGQILYPGNRRSEYMSQLLHWLLKFELNSISSGTNGDSNGGAVVDSVELRWLQVAMVASSLLSHIMSTSSTLFFGGSMLREECQLLGHDIISDRNPWFWALDVLHTYLDKHLEGINTSWDKEDNDDANRHEFALANVAATISTVFAWMPPASVSNIYLSERKLNGANRPQQVASVEHHGKKSAVKKGKTRAPVSYIASEVEEGQGGAKLRAASTRALSAISLITSLWNLFTEEQYAHIAHVLEVATCNALEVAIIAEEADDPEFADKLAAEDDDTSFVIRRLEEAGCIGREQLAAILNTLAAAVPHQNPSDRWILIRQRASCRPLVYEIITRTYTGQAQSEYAHRPRLADGVSSSSPVRLRTLIRSPSGGSSSATVPNSNTPTKRKYIQLRNQYPLSAPIADGGRSMMQDGKEMDAAMTEQIFKRERLSFADDMPLSTARSNAAGVGDSLDSGSSSPAHDDLHYGKIKSGYDSESSPPVKTPSSRAKIEQAAGDNRKQRRRPLYKVVYNDDDNSLTPASMLARSTALALRVSNSPEDDSASPPPAANGSVRYWGSDAEDVFVVSMSSSREKKREKKEEEGKKDKEKKERRDSATHKHISASTSNSLLEKGSNKSRTSQVTVPAPILYAEQDSADYQKDVGDDVEIKIPLCESFKDEEEGAPDPIPAKEAGAGKARIAEKSRLHVFKQIPSTSSSSSVKSEKSVGRSHQKLPMELESESIKGSQQSHRDSKPTSSKKFDPFSISMRPSTPTMPVSAGSYERPQQLQRQQQKAAQPAPAPTAAAASSHESVDKWNASDLMKKFGV